MLYLYCININHETYNRLVNGFILYKILIIVILILILKLHIIMNYLFLQSRY